jgi:Ca2+-binding RTX toxin-like protein
MTNHPTNSPLTITNSQVNNLSFTVENLNPGPQLLRDIIATDLNNDGLTDIVSTATDQVVALFNQNTTAGTVQNNFNPVKPIISNISPVEIIAGDINKDSQPDLVTRILPYNLQLFINNTATSFTPQSSPLQIPNPTASSDFFPLNLTLADINNDGKQDLLSNESNNRSIFINLGNTANSSNTITWGNQSNLFLNGYSNGMVVADFNQDSRPDILAHISPMDNAPNRHLALWLNNTEAGGNTASFSQPNQIPISKDPNFLLVADVNSDGKIDLITADKKSENVDIFDPSNNTGEILVYLNNTNSNNTNQVTFAAPQTILNGFIPTDLTTATDLNKDQKPDLAILEDNRISLVVNTTSSNATTTSWETPWQISIPGENLAFTTGDFNRDNSVDFAVANQIPLSDYIGSPSDLKPNIAIAYQNSSDNSNDNPAILGTANNDYLNGTNGNETINGLAGDDTLFGNQGNDFLLGGTNNDWLHGNEGEDTLSGETGSDTLYGGKQADILSGDKIDDLIGGNDLLFGNRENDQLFGGVGNDTLLGGKDNDQLFGENGDDQLKGELGNDTLTGGGGSDVFILQLNGGTDQIVDFTDNVDKIGLFAGLTFPQLTINTVGNITNISAGNQVLATLNISNDLLSDSDFVIMA